jgi:predicted CopG family antitoxin
MDNTNEKKVKIELKTWVVNKLIKLKEVGDTYSDVIARLLKKGE